MQWRCFISKMVSTLALIISLIIVNVVQLALA